jgi:outer membrane protein assembly factor BamB
MTGGILWEAFTGGSSNSSPAIGADGTVYVGSDDGRVYAVR